MKEDRYKVKQNLSGSKNLGQSLSGPVLIMTPSVNLDKKLRGIKNLGSHESLRDSASNTMMKSLQIGVGHIFANALDKTILDHSGVKNNKFSSSFKKPAKVVKLKAGEKPNK